jgi:hypothetical protein
MLRTRQQLPELHGNTLVPSNGSALVQQYVQYQRNFQRNVTNKDTSQISNLTVASFKHTVCVKKAAEEIIGLTKINKCDKAYIYTTNCAFLIIVKLAFHKAKHQTGFPHSRLSEENQLERK